MNKCATILLLSAALAAVLMSGQPACDRRTSRTYTVADAEGDWGYPNPYGMYPRGPGYVRMSFIYETLVWKDRDGDIVPALATDWEYQEADTAYLFRIRGDARWHDGRPVTPADVVFTYRYIQQHPWPWVDGDIVADVSADGDRVKVKLGEPYAPFMTNVAGTLPILPRHIWKDVEDPGQFRGQGAAVGCGPYRLEEYSAARGSYLLTAFQDYYRGTPAVERLQFVTYSREMAPAALRGGNLNASRVPAETVESLRGSDLQLISQPPSWAAKLMINHRDRPLSDRKMRHALAYAIDCKRIADIVRRGHAIAGSPGLLPPSTEPWHNPDVPRYEQDPARAEEILRGLGYERGPDGIFQKGGEPLTFTLLCSPQRMEFGRLAELLEQQLEEAGIGIEVRSAEASVLDSRLKEWQFELAISGHGGLGGDPEILNRMVLGKSFNSARYRKNEPLVELLKRQVHTTDRAERQRMVHRAQELYAEELPAITLYHPQWYWAHDGRVDLYHTPGGMALGIPLPLNKLSFVRTNRP